MTINFTFQQYFFSPEKLTTAPQDYHKLNSLRSKSHFGFFFQFHILNDIRFIKEMIGITQDKKRKIEEFVSFKVRHIAWFELHFDEISWQQLLKHVPPAFELQFLCLFPGLLNFSSSSNIFNYLFIYFYYFFDMDIQARRSLRQSRIEFHSLGKIQKAIKCHGRCFNIAIKLESRAGEERDHRNLGSAYQSLSEFQKTLSIV